MLVRVKAIPRKAPGLLLDLYIEYRGLCMLLSLVPWKDADNHNSELGHSAREPSIYWSTCHPKMHLRLT